MRRVPVSWVGRYLSWLKKPQLLASYAALCLLAMAYSGLVRTQIAPRIVEHTVAAPAVQGAATIQRPPLPAVDCSLKPCIALTFDDGPDSRITPQILDILRAHDARATFFLVGREVSGREDLVQRIYREGNEIGNHSWDHQDFTTLNDQQIDQEISTTQTAIANAGVPLPTIFRPPYGAVDDHVRTHVQLPLIRWNVDTEDWYTKDAARVSEHLLHDVHPGSIILMHDKYDATAAATQSMVPVLQQQYQLVTISQLLALSSGDQGQYFNR